MEYAITVTVPVAQLRALQFHVKQQDKRSCITVKGLLQLKTWTTLEPAWQQL